MEINEIVAVSYLPNEKKVRATGTPREAQTELALQHQRAQLQTRQQAHVKLAVCK